MTLLSYYIEDKNILLYRSVIFYHKVKFSYQLCASIIHLIFFAFYFTHRHYVYEYIFVFIFNCLPFCNFKTNTRLESVEIEEALIPSVVFLSFSHPLCI